jgi:hypothetical protein
MAGEGSAGASEDGGDRTGVLVTDGGQPPEDGDRSSGNGESEPTRGSESAKWRCAWCGKPHARNDPPCDNCGHHKFEKAVVPVAPETEGYERQPVWVCPECGREHQKNSPPCSRCGNAKLEKHVPSEEDYAEELSGTSYLDVLEPQYVLGLAIALVAGAVLVLALLGVVTLPGMGPSLNIADVPGNASEASGVDLAETERAYLASINDARADAGVERLDRNENLDDVARFLNQRTVKATYTDAEVPGNDPIRGPLRDACGESQPVQFSDSRPLAGNSSAFDSPDALAAVLDDAFLDEDAATEGFSAGRTGVDVHVGPDGRVFVIQIVC